MDLNKYLASVDRIEDRILDRYERLQPKLRSLETEDAEPQFLAAERQFLAESEQDFAELVSLLGITEDTYRSEVNCWFLIAWVKNQQAPPTRTDIQTYYAVLEIIQDLDYYWERERGRQKSEAKLLDSLEAAGFVVRHD